MIGSEISLWAAKLAQDKVNSKLFLVELQVELNLVSGHVLLDGLRCDCELDCGL